MLFANRLVHQAVETSFKFLISLFLLYTGTRRCTRSPFNQTFRSRLPLPTRTRTSNPRCQRPSHPFGPRSIEMFQTLPGKGIANRIVSEWGGITPGMCVRSGESRQQTTDDDYPGGWEFTGLISKGGRRERRSPCRKYWFQWIIH